MRLRGRSYDRASETTAPVGPDFGQPRCWSGVGVTDQESRMTTDDRMRGLTVTEQTRGQSATDPILSTLGHCDRYLRFVRIVVDRYEAANAAYVDHAVRFKALMKEAAGGTGGSSSSRLTEEDRRGSWLSGPSARPCIWRSRASTSPESGSLAGRVPSPDRAAPGCSTNGLTITRRIWRPGCWPSLGVRLIDGWWLLTSN